MKDLHAFAASIMEIMVGQDSEPNTAIVACTGKHDHVTKKKVETPKVSAPTPVGAVKPAPSITGRITMDSIPLNWCKFKQSFVLIEIL